MTFTTAATENLIASITNSNVVNFRASDIGKILDACSNENRQEVAEYIADRRPELTAPLAREIAMGKAFGRYA